MKLATTIIGKATDDIIDKGRKIAGFLLEHLDRPPPCQFLGVVDLTQVQHVPLHNAPAGDPRVLENAPIAMLLAILPANLAAQEHEAANYRHIGDRENRLGRHYSRFAPFRPAASLADQSLALRKLQNAGVESAKLG
jgi:hypothetical protein